jgi:hypothetical protein
VILNYIKKISNGGTNPPFISSIVCLSSDLLACFVCYKPCTAVVHGVCSTMITFLALDNKLSDFKKSSDNSSQLGLKKERKQVYESMEKS